MNVLKLIVSFLIYRYLLINCNLLSTPEYYPNVGVPQGRILNLLTLINLIFTIKQKSILYKIYLFSTTKLRHVPKSNVGFKFDSISYMDSQILPIIKQCNNVKINKYLLNTKFDYLQNLTTY